MCRRGDRIVYWLCAHKAHGGQRPEEETDYGPRAIPWGARLNGNLQLLRKKKSPYRPGSGKAGSQSYLRSIHETDLYVFNIVN